MSKPYFTLSILVLASLLAGCAPKGSPQPGEVRALENPTPTGISKISQPANATKSETDPSYSSDDCPVTVSQDLPFNAPAPYSPDAPFQNQFWYGSESLWTLLPTNGTWEGLPQNSEGYTQKIFWWRTGYVWNEEPQPELKVTGERLDAKVPPLIVSDATNAYASDIGSAMLVGVDFPTLGCWQITGKYKDAELSFVIWVAQ